jgi:hypothetical protein
MVIQGRNIGPDDIQASQCLMMDNPNWGRSRLSVELCQRWGWKGPNQQIKDMACRTLLLKLERAGHIVLPARRGPSPNSKRNRCLVPVATKGRTRNDRDASIHAPIKDIYVYPLSKRWRDGLMSC